MYESSNSQCPVVLFNVALWEPLLSVKESSFLSRLALTLSVVAFALIVSVAAFLVVSEETGHISYFKNGAFVKFKDPDELIKAIQADF